MFVRVKTTPNSPRKSVQIVESIRRGDQVRQKIVRYVGIAMNDEELEKLKDLATEICVRMEEAASRQESLLGFEGEVVSKLAAKRLGRPKKKTLSEVLPTSEVSIYDVAEEKRVVEGPHEVLCPLYEYLGFNRILKTRSANEVLRDLVLARLMTPESKHRTQVALETTFGRAHSLDRIYRVLDQLQAALPRMKKLVYQSTTSLVQGRIDVAFFDVTTLYFESTEEDELRAFGYSKDQKFHCTQVVLALATNEDGLPIGYELFRGNTAEVSTLVACLEQWRRQLEIGEVTFVADRALCSRKNLEALEAAGLNYVIGMPLRRSLPKVQANAILTSKRFKPVALDEELIWHEEFDFEGKRLLVTYSQKRAKKDAKDRERLIDSLKKKLGSSKNAKKLVSNRGYLKYVESVGQPGTFIIDKDKVEADQQWDGLHAVLTNVKDAHAMTLLAQYRRLWVIEESFRIQKHTLAVRPIFHFKPERIEAHIGLCFLSFALLRQTLQRVRLAQTATTPQKLRDTLLSVQASILKHRVTGDRYHSPSPLGHEANALYKTFGLKRSRDTTPYLK